MAKKIKVECELTKLQFEALMFATPVILSPTIDWNILRRAKKKVLDGVINDEAIDKNDYNY